MIVYRNILKQRVRHTRSKKGDDYWYMLEGTKWSRVSKEVAIEARYGTKVGVRKGRVLKNVQRYIDNGNFSIADRAYFESTVDRAVKEGRTWTIQQIQAIASENKIAVAIANTGLDANKLAAEWGCSVSELLDPANWTGDVFNNPNNGVSYQVTWNYEEGSSWERI